MSVHSKSLSACPFIDTKNRYVARMETSGPIGRKKFEVESGSQVQLADPSAYACSVRQTGIQLERQARGQLHDK